MKTNKIKPKIKKPLIKSPNLFPVVGIGASAGGLDAFKKLLKAIPENSGMAYVLVQHLDPSHESLLPELLQKVTSIPVLEISDDIKVEPNHIYVIPSNKMMVATDGVLLLASRPAKSKNIRNLPIDLFFTSLAEVHQSHAIGVVLSGTASDGTLGLKAIKDHGGITFAQDEESAAYEGMPHSAAQAGVVDFILPPEKIPQKILEVNKSITGKSGDEQTLPEQDEDVFKQIISLLRIHKGTDFSYYKQTTIRRRILRRVALNKKEEPAAYLTYLKENKPERDVLYQDLLIPVTSFFRDDKSFDNLCETVFPLIIKNKTPGEPIRVWVAGCSTGEEAYSIAICLKEFLGDHSSTGPGERVQIFATDINEQVIKKGRIGIYAKNEVDSVTPQRLHEFFTKTNGSYQVNKPVRDMCVFAVHNFLKDPPFGKMDFISCRNVLIYMEPYLQKKALTTFHYSLNPKGFLLLGKSETTSSTPDLFASAAKNDKLFSRKDVPGRFMHVASRRSEENLSPADPGPKNEPIRTDFQKTADDIMLRKYTPAGVVVNEVMDIVHFRGNTGSYLEQSPGKPSHNLLKMAKHGLAFELRNILHKTKKEKAPAIKENIPLQVNGILMNISIEAIPLPNTIEPYYLILFHEKPVGSGQLTVGSKKTTSSKTKNDDKDLRIQQLEKELEQTREDMRSITEDQEASNEELQSANEELQSANEELLSSSEELQSLNEELETGKEELQSTNEELMVVNQEMVSLNEQVAAARNYSESIVSNIREPLLVLDKTLQIKTANNAFYKTFQVTERETEGVLIYDLGNKQWNIPALRMLLEKILPEKSLFNDFEVTHTFSTIGERVMLLNAREVINKNSSEKLILLSIEDITEQKKAEEEQRQIQKRFHFIADSMPQKVWTADAEGNINYFNKCWLEYTGLTFEKLKDWGWKRVIHPDDWEENKKQWQHSIDTGNNFELEHRILSKDGEYKWHLSRGLAYKDDNGRIIMWIGTNTDMNFIKEEEQRKDDFIKMVSHELKTPVTSIKGYVQLLLNMLEDEHATDFPLNIKPSLVRIDKLVLKLTRLITEILDLSRIETGRLELQKELFSLNDIVKETVEDILYTDSTQTINVYQDLSCTIYGDKDRIGQVIINFIANAIKYSPDNNTIEVRVQAAEKNQVAVSVKDYGIGIDKIDHKNIFERFYRVDGKNEQTYPGFGIGLFIANTIIERHNGFITIESEKGKGSVFTFILPVAVAGKDSHGENKN